MRLTDAQLKAVLQRKSNILISAAAGSGKTAVLVERICQKICDNDNPVDADRFLVVTFTKAAAGQMRDKIAAKLEGYLENEPDNKHLIKQITLIHNADICTIDSFCYKLVKEYSCKLGIDSSYSIVDNTVITLCMQDVMDELFEEKYGEQDFDLLMDVFSDGKTNDGLKKVMSNLYYKAVSFPRPLDWLEKTRNGLSVESIEEIEERDWFKEVVESVHASVRDIIDTIRRNGMLCDSDGGPDLNAEVTESDIEAVSRIQSANSYEELRQTFNISWNRLKTCKGEKYDEDICNRFKRGRDGYKSIIKKLNMFVPDKNQVIEDIKNLRSFLIPLIDLTQEFYDRFRKEKDKKRMLEFSDVTHMAYELVCGGYTDDGYVIPTDIGRIISENYDEIYIDEYQDSNFLQEDILCSVSRMPNDNNIFMVGDVKQSIYGFRMARPDLFLSKYNSYQDSGDKVLIKFMSNFRSRAVVLDAVNYLFCQIMGKDIGGIVYDNDAALVPKAVFPDKTDDVQGMLSNSTEVIFVDRKQTNEALIEASDEEQEMAKLEIEAHVIAKRIKDLLNDDKLIIFDDKTNQYRPLKYKDIVILTRSLKGVGEVLFDVLDSQGIPVYVEESTGYFEASEIQVIMSMLAVIDNCMQDIPLAAVLLSPMCSIDENELAIINDYVYKHSEIKNKKKLLLYDKCRYYIEDFELQTDKSLFNEEIVRKLNRIVDIIEELKTDRNYMSISSLISKMLELTGYYEYLISMPMGTRRKANINMLLWKADEYENGYYKGLFNFLRYVERLKFNEVDFGEANTLSDEEDVVRIMTMHKSKGLEYPVVFVSALGKQFNMMDLREKMIINNDYGIACKMHDVMNRLIKDTFIRDAYVSIMKNALLAEEMRVLYVALTRAKEKLIITGCDNDISKYRDGISFIENESEMLLPYSVRSSFKSFLNMIQASTIRYEKKAAFNNNLPNIDIKIITSMDKANDISKDKCDKQNTIDRFVAYADSIDKGEYYEEYKNSFEYCYPYEEMTEKKSKLSISEIKRMYMQDEEIDIHVFNEKEQQETDTGIHSKDSVMSGDITGAQRGTIIHKFMELINFKDAVMCDTHSDYMNRISESKLSYYEKGIFTIEELDAIPDENIAFMLESSLGRRMAEADLRNELYKEQQFSIGIPASDIYDAKSDDDDIVVVQGVIDAFFYENGNVVLMDYKTDKCDAQTLKGRYKVQLDYYAKTLEQLTGFKVISKSMYSFYLNEEVII